MDPTIAEQMFSYKVARAAGQPRAVSPNQRFAFFELGQPGR